MKKNVYTTTPVAGGWAGAVMNWAGAVMSWAEGVMIWAGACSNRKFPTLKIPENAKKQSVTDGRTDPVTYRSRCPRQKKKKKKKKKREKERLDYLHLTNSSRILVNINDHILRDGKASK